jgi:hypothetical protein
MGILFKIEITVTRHPSPVTSHKKSKLLNPAQKITQ